MLSIYYVILFLVGLLASPLLLFKAKARAGVWQKLGFVPKGLNFGRSPLWIHAVSVGEFNAVWPLLTTLHERYPQLSIVISTTTKTGQEQAKQRAGTFAQVVYFPYDMPWSVNNWFNAIQPAAVLIVETETWPGFYATCKKRNVPVILVNGRISPRSYRRFQRLRILFGKALSNASLILAQSKEEAERYRDLTGGAVPIQVTGNLKFDGLKAIDPNQRIELYRSLKLSNNDLVLVGGSTHEGEESALLHAASALMQEGMKPRLILAPRHPERFARAAELAEQQGFRPRRFSKGEGFEQDNDVYILDAIGHLMKYYSVANIAFVGGTLAPIGGHNLVEPSVYGVPVVCGPHIEKTRDTARALLEHDALILGQNETELIEQISSLAKQPELRLRLGKNGQAWLQNSYGAVGRALAALEQFPCILSGSNAANDLAAHSYIR